MRTKGLKILFFTLVAALITRGVQAQEAPKAAPKGPSEKIFAGDYDAVWNKVVEVLTEKGLSEHPHGKMSADKDSGKIMTPIFRYFRIYSAKPVKEVDYRDSYTITVSRTDTPTSSALAEAASAKAEDKAGAKEGSAEAPKAAPKGKGKFVKVQIQRKFEMYDNEKKQWVEGDPAKENVGYTEESLLKAIEAKVEAPSAAGAPTESVKPNLNLTPPLNPG